MRSFLKSNENLGDLFGRILCSIATFDRRLRFNVQTGRASIKLFTIFYYVQVSERLFYHFGSFRVYFERFPLISPYDTGSDEAANLVHSLRGASGIKIFL